MLNKYTIIIINIIITTTTCLLALYMEQPRKADNRQIHHSPTHIIIISLVTTVLSHCFIYWHIFQSFQ